MRVPASSLNEMVQSAHPCTSPSGTDGWPSNEEEANIPKGERAVTVLDAWTKAQRQLKRGVTMREIVRGEFEDIYPGDVEQVCGPPEVVAVRVFCHDAAGACLLGGRLGVRRGSEARVGFDGRVQAPCIWSL